MGLGTQLAQAGQNEPAPRLDTGTVIAINWTESVAMVNVRGSTIPAAMCGEQPNVGGHVWVLSVGDTALIIGKPARPAMGTVQSSPSQGFVSIATDDGKTRSLPYSVDDPPVAGQRWLLDWAADGHAIARASGEVGAPPYTPETSPLPGLGGGGVQERTFHPTDSGSFRGGWWTSKVYYAENNTVGAYFYGTSIKDTIPDNAPISKVQIYLNCELSQGSSSTFWGLHGFAGKPTGSGFSINDDVDKGYFGVGGGWYDFPLAWGDALKVGTSLGIGTAGPGYRIFTGVEGGQQHGAIRIEWTE